MPSYVLQRKVFEGVRWSDEQRRVAWEDAYQSAKGRGSGHPKKKAKEKSDDENKKEIHEQIFYIVVVLVHENHRLIGAGRRKSRAREP